MQISAASSTEAVLKRELAALGYAPEGARYGRIRVAGDMRDVAKCNVFLRTAGRVRIIIADFPAQTFDELFDAVYAINWRDILPRDAAVTVTAKSVKSRLYSLSDIQRITKKAIAAKMCSAYGCARMSETGAVYGVEACADEDVFTLALDTSGDGLHKRGYRIYLGDAPIRETLAAAVLQLSVWRKDRPFADPFCGSGTFPIEAAMISANIAPGLTRSFAFEKFSNAPPVSDSVREEARALIDRSYKPRIQGFDINPAAVRLAVKHAERAGVRELIHFQTADMRAFSSRYSHGVIFANPPYGERLMTPKEVESLYRDFGTVFSRLDEWSAYVITSFRGFEKHFGRRADRTRKLYNSEIECNLFTFLGAPPRRRNDEQSNTRENKK